MRTIAVIALSLVAGGSACGSNNLGRSAMDEQEGERP
jgi:hypothetical protein